MAGDSKKIGIAALTTNFGVAVARFGAAIATGLSATHSAGVHDLIDRQVLNAIEPLTGRSVQAGRPDIRCLFLAPTLFSAA